MTVRKQDDLKDLLAMIERVQGASLVISEDVIDNLIRVPTFKRTNKYVTQRVLIARRLILSLICS